MNSSDTRIVSETENEEEARLHQRASEETVVVPVIEEFLSLGKRLVETGGVRIHKTVEEHLETVDLPLLNDFVEVERVPVGKPVEGTPAVRREGDTLIVPILEEVLVIEKRLILKEELHIRMRREELHSTEQVSLRREHVEIERHPVNRPVSEADMSAFREGTIEVKETAEVPVVAKEARIVEEVVVGKQATERTETVRETVRRTDVEVQQIVGQHRGRFDEYDNFAGDFRGNYQSQYGAQGGRYEDYEPAYRYGYDIASDPRYVGRDWNSVQPDLQHDWETREPGSWNRFSNAIQYAWERAANSVRNGVQTGGRAVDGTPGTRGVVEEVSDAVTGDRIDDKTGKVVR